MIYCLILIKIYWISAFFVYSLKFLFKKFDEFSDYGKLVKMKQKYSIPNKIGWRSFYFFGFSWNLILLFMIITNKSIFSKIGNVIKIEDDIEYLKKIRVLFLNTKDFYSSLQIWILWIFLQIQFIRRFLECLFVHKFRPEQMNFFNFLSGISFYFFVPMTFLLFFSGNNYQNEKNLFNVFFKNNFLNHFFNINFFTFFGSVFLFIFGSISQNRSHRILRDVRDKKEKKGDIGYYVIYEGYFQYVSSPHYFFEIIIYFSFLLLNNFKNLWSFVCFLFVCMNLVHNSIKTDEWYRKKFRDYPEERKKLIPFIF
ncbi:polyprenol reductase [Anaeramoeba ignava]|uniref:Polyprenol reductase n=1 Tax=Anaeramoeba ignava TaxID=1746090 RepID=A0A9Q0LTT9_ANAIG|nr:polyprenol reductase [Anaeramoeba ignava]